MLKSGTFGGLAVAMVFLGVPNASGQQTPPSDALREYVQRPDSAYSWEVVRQVEGDEATTYVVRLASQRWRTAKDVDRVLWEHWLVVVKPKEIAAKKAFLFIGGGSNENGPPSRAGSTPLQIARATRSVVAELKMVPNQPLEFHGDGEKRSEDDLIGYGWAQFLDSGDATWLPRLPMVKSAVRAMDCVQELLASPAGDNQTIDGFVVAGGSKRGWTTWMTAAADSRVEAIVPIVIDVLNVDPSMRHHAAVYGFWAEAIGNYVQHGITQRWDDPQMEDLYAVVDPYYHRERLSMPKFIVNACGDQFFCPDSSQFYFDELVGEKYVRYVPNADHSLDGSDAAESIAAFYWTLLNGKPRPQFRWSFEPEGAIRVETEDRPETVLLWQATNPDARDFRVDTIGQAYTSRPLADQGNGVYVGRVDSPDRGWTAYLVELTFDVGGPAPLKMTTAVRVTPDRLPYAGVDPNKIPYEKQQ
jgi:PhoPQ-activated pathogenicity-related protein